MVAHACRDAPAECCGLLVGTPAVIERAVAARNIAEAASTRFLIDPRDHIAARRQARLRGLDVCGFYHSHPQGTAEPSPADLAEASYDGSLYVILGLGTEPADVKAFRLTGARFVPVRLAG